MPLDFDLPLQYEPQRVMQLPREREMNLILPSVVAANLLAESSSPRIVSPHRPVLQILFYAGMDSVRLKRHGSETE